MWRGRKEPLTFGPDKGQRFDPPGPQNMHTFCLVLFVVTGSSKVRPLTPRSRVVQAFVYKASVNTSKQEQPGAEGHKPRARTFVGWAHQSTARHREVTVAGDLLNTTTSLKVKDLPRVTTSTSSTGAVNFQHTSSMWVLVRVWSNKKRMEPSLGPRDTAQRYPARGATRWWLRCV